MRMAEAGVSICNRNRIMTGLRSPRAVSTIVLATIRPTAATLIPDIPFSSSIRDSTGSTRARLVSAHLSRRLLILLERVGVSPSGRQ
jgi:hypothetical protein